MKLSQYTLEATVFIVGAVIMIFELVGSRVLGPYFGTSIFVWTSLIGIILGSLSLGYYYGGKVADKNPSFKSLSLIIFQSGVFIGLMIMFKDFLLAFLLSFVPGVRLASVIASVVLFFPASFSLGMVSPYAAKLKLTHLSNAGATIGNLYAISTTGSIVGTFLCGFYLIPHFGTNTLLMTLAIALILVSLLLWRKPIKSIEVCTIVLCIIGWNVVSGFNLMPRASNFIDIDTAYNRIWIYDMPHYDSDKTVRIMGINNENHSSMFLESDELSNEYSKYYHLVRHFNPSFQTALLLGGAGYSYPKDYLLQYPEATMDVVEIDPKVTELAKQYFRLKEDPRLVIYHQDARVFLNALEKKYDVIYGDAFGSRYSIPYQLTTVEAVQKMYDALNDDGIVIQNIISAIEGDGGQFLRAEYATFASIFPQLYLFPTRDPSNGELAQNIVMVALKSDTKPSMRSTDRQLNAYLQNVWKKDITLDMPLLTDDFAPVDYYVSQAL
jgi:spermidine synthase